MTAERWSELKSLFGRAIDLESGEQSRLVAEATAEDPELGRSLRSLLDHHETASTLLEGPILSQERIAEYLTAGVKTFQEGEIAGNRFRILQFLGEGGMGEVYRAEDLELGRPVALKTLRPALAADERLVRQLKQETYTAQRVTHRNVCRIFDLFRHDAGGGQTVIFIAMELLQGETLAQRIRRRGRIPIREALPIAEQIAHALDAAHDAGIIHRDLKSGNVLMTESPDGSERVVITDFGLACGAQESGDAATGPIAGTLAYAAPEQLSGGAATVAADLYSFGVVMFEMVTGQLPFPPGSLREARDRRLLPPPSPRSLVPRLAPQWDAAITACLQPDPARRPAGGEAILRRLRSNPRARRRWSAIAAALMAAAGGWWYVERPVAFDPEAVRCVQRGQDFARRRNEEGLHNAVAEFQKAARLEPRFTEAWVGIADAYSAMANFDIMPPKTALRAARDAALHAISMRDRSARALGVMGYITSLDVERWRDAEPYFLRAAAAGPKDAMVRLWYGAHLSKLGRSEDAFRELRKGLELDPMSLTLNQQLATEFFRTRRYPEYYNQAKELVRLQPFEPSSHLALARALECLKRYDEALAECGEAEKYSGSMTSVCFRASIEAARGRWDAARQDADRVRAHWSSHPFQAELLASVYARIGDARQAVGILDQGYDRGDSTVLTAPTTPYFDPLQGDAGYAQFLRRIGWEH